jgi:hypothetical protein
VLPVIVALAMLGAALALVPPAFDAGWQLYVQDDPGLLADHVVARTLTPAVVDREISAALDGGDTELAESFASLARERGIAVAPALTERLDGAVKDAASVSHQANRFVHGFVTGEPDDMVGLAGTAVGDLFVFGDIRDALREGVHYTRGEAVDELVLGLACVGLAVTAGTYASLGAGTPARAGLSLVKAARKTGRLSARLARFVGQTLQEAVDFAALRRASTGASLAQPAAAVRAAREAVKVERLGRLADLGRDIGRVQRAAGTRAAMDGMRIAESPRELGRLARLAEAQGSKTRAILKLAGRAALVLTTAVMNLVGWVFWALMVLWSLVSAVKSTTERCTRRVLHWRKGRRMRRAGDFRQATASSSHPVAAPAAAHKTTTSQGGIFQQNSNRNAAAAMAKSTGRVTPDVHTG